MEQLKKPYDSMSQRQKNLYNLLGILKARKEIKEELILRHLNKSSDNLPPQYQTTKTM